ncbi:MAG TPA: hypothetical protein VM818_00895 [Vicinamibacterales bacterium]|nr:hypothetical protein [Vicinamibacterales bacterium]
MRRLIEIFAFIAVVVAVAAGLVPLTQTVLLLPLACRERRSAL